jgi:hypothetical protein
VDAFVEAVAEFVSDARSTRLPVRDGAQGELASHLDELAEIRHRVVFGKLGKTGYLSLELLAAGPEVGAAKIRGPVEGIEQRWLRLAERGLVPCSAGQASQHGPPGQDVAPVLRLTVGCQKGEELFSLRIAGFGVRLAPVLTVHRAQKQQFPDNARVGSGLLFGVRPVLVDQHAHRAVGTGVVTGRLRR